MDKLIDGARRFRTEVFAQNQFLFHKLSHGQNPKVLFIACADSRVAPELITQSQPGDMLVLRNAGNIVPPFGASSGGEAATIELAVSFLGVTDIVVCGHSQCAAIEAMMSGMVENEILDHWLNQASATRAVLQRKKPTSEHAHDRSIVGAQEHVLLQLQSLKTHPSVAAKVATGDVELHGWVYKVETGEVQAYDEELSAFLPLTTAHNEHQPSDMFFAQEASR